MSMMSYVWSCVDQKNVRLRWFFAIIPSLLFLGWGGLTAIEDSLIVFHSSTTSMSSGLFKRLLIDDNDHNIHLPTNTTNRGI